MPVLELYIKEAKQARPLAFESKIQTRRRFFQEFQANG